MDTHGVLRPKRPELMLAPAMCGTKKMNDEMSCTR